MTWTCYITFQPSTFFDIMRTLKSGNNDFLKSLKDHISQTKEHSLLMFQPVSTQFLLPTSCSYLKNLNVLWVFPLKCTIMLQIHFSAILTPIKVKIFTLAFHTFCTSAFTELTHLPELLCISKLPFYFS